MNSFEVIDEAIGMLIDNDNGIQGLSFSDLYGELEVYIGDARGSGSAHHAWLGGYFDHVAEVLRIADGMWGSFNFERELPFSFISVIKVLLLHDIEKPFKRATYEQLSHFNWIKKAPGKSDKKFLKKVLKEYGIQLTKEEKNALKYVEGEGDDYVNGKRVMNELAAFCHACDVLSARLWWDYPLDHE